MSDAAATIETNSLSSLIANSTPQWKKVDSGTEPSELAVVYLWQLRYVLWNQNLNILICMELSDKK